MAEKNKKVASTDSSAPKESREAGAGKGDLYRSTDVKKTDAFWIEWCRTHGHSYVNRICKYCGEFDPVRPDWMDD